MTPETPADDVPEIVAENFTPLDPRLTGDRWIGVVNRLREQCPIFHSSAHEDEGFFVLTKHDDLKFAHHRVDLYSSCPITIPPAGLTRPWGPIEADPPVHKQLRGVLNSYFSFKHIATEERYYRELLLPMLEPVVARGEADLASELLIPFPLRMIIEKFAIPDADKERLVHLFYLFAHKPGAMEDPADAQRTVELAAQEVYLYFAGLVAERRTAPGDDFVSLLCAAEIDGEPLSDWEIIDYSMLLFAAGFETTAYSLGYAFLYLARHGDVRREIARDLSLVPPFLEELLRYETPVKALGRTVMVDHTRRGQELRRGDRVMMLWGAGNRDPDEFESPDVFDIHRKPNRHLAYGAGPHRCMGIHMARLSMKIVLEEWLTRVPDFTVDVEQVHEVPGATWAVTSLPARWPIPA
jgi:cytochrome P450